MNRALIVGLACLLLARFAGAQSTIELRPRARIAAAGAAVSLAQVAKLDGPDAQALAGVSIVEAGQATPAKVSVDDVKRSLDGHGKVNWGRITLRGSVCLLDAPASEPINRTIAEAKTPPQQSDTADTGTVKEAVVARVAQIVQAPRENLRLTFATEDADLLRISTAGRTLEIRPTAIADRMPLSVTVFEGDRIVGDAKTIRVGVQVKRTVLVALAPKRRGDNLDAADFSTEDRWLGPTQRPASAEQTIGFAARSRIDTGDVVMVDDVAPAVVVNKGDVVAIRCVSGSLALTTRGRALAQGRDGDLIEFQAMDSKRTFFARMDGRGRAIIAAANGSEPEPSRRPTPHSRPHDKIEPEAPQ